EQKRGTCGNRGSAKEEARLCFLQGANPSDGARRDEETGLFWHLSVCFYPQPAIRSCRNHMWPLLDPILDVLWRNVPWQGR
ncbi:hypothetical protein BGX28_002235, partial [Mortierella sp. GBA30]